jgi:hypothetical protein
MIGYGAAAVTYLLGLLLRTGIGEADTAVLSAEPSGLGGPATDCFGLPHVDVTTHSR